MSTNEATTRLYAAAAKLREQDIDPNAITAEQFDALMESGEYGDITDGVDFTTGLGIGARSSFTYGLGYVTDIDDDGTQTILWADNTWE